MSTTSPSASLPIRKPSTLPKRSYAALRAVTPAHFAYTVSEGRWTPFEHLLLLNRKLVDVAAGRIRRLMVFMPPRHGKSELTSRYFPAWYLGTFPDKRIILASYEADFAATWGRKARNLLEEFGPSLFGVKVSDDSAAAARWDIAEHEGGMVTAGVRGPITGKGANVAIIDDPVKNDQEAMSQTYRDATWDWYRATFSTRIQEEGAIILVMTRWHEDDLAGRLLRAQEEGGDRWEVVNLPALAEENDMLGRQPGEPLCPELFTKETLEATKIRLGSYWWNALYQQRPSPMEGGILKRSWWRYYRQLPERFDEVIQSWDMSFKETTSGSYVVGQVWGRKRADKYLLDQVRDRMDFPATLQAVRQLSARWPQARAKLVEDKANGPAVIATLKREIPGLIAVEPQGSKEARAAAVSPDIEAGNVYLPDPSIAPWVHDFVEECAAFPNGANDDQVDAMTQALNRFNSRSLAAVLTPIGIDGISRWRR
ncbi:MAG: phage terminase large subunit [Clostridia bacterium]|nr:phage terminase large subunit [Clostridia bacterium]